jgi:hypothetical protein
MARGREGRSSAAYRGLQVQGQLCWQGCGRPATTRDHVPAIALHHHVEGSGCCQVLPACRPCNSRDGQRITAELNRRRAIIANLTKAQAKRRRYGLLAEESQVF